MTPHQLERADLVLRQTNEKVQALFHKVHNVQVEVQELRSEVTPLLNLLRELLQNPSIENEVAAVVRDYKFSQKDKYR